MHNLRTGKLSYIHILILTILLFSQGNFAFGSGTSTQDKLEQFARDTWLAEEPDKAVAPVPTVTVSPDNETDKGVLYRLEMHLSGSNCIACLKDLERKITKLGVDSVNLEYPGGNTFEAYSTPGLAWAKVVIIFNTKKVSLTQIKMLIKKSGFYPFWTSKKRL